jgi:PilZ domain
MEGPVRERPLERRVAPRFDPASEGRVVRSRLRAGHEARILDISSRGALIESDRRLAPGARLVLQISMSGAHFELEGRVIRAEVSALVAAGVRYRGAIQFDREAVGIVKAAALPDGASASQALRAAQRRAPRHG